MALKKKKKMKFSGQVLSRAGFGLVLFLLFALALITSLTGPRKVGGFRLFSVQSASMSPALRAGSLILVKEQTNYQKGDIITFAKNLDLDKKVSKVVTHRIVDQAGEEGEIYYATKGDANENSDKDLIKKSDVLGKVILSLPLLGYLIAYTQTLTGLIILIVVPGTIIIYSELLKLKKEILHLWRKGKSKKRKKGKTQVNKISKAAILICLLWVLKNFSGTTFSYYNDFGEVQSLSFSLGDWTRPESSITSSENLVNTHNFEIVYEAVDNDLDYVELWFSFNLGDWQLGEFNFTSPLGDGLYQFITVAVDGSGNVEDKNGNDFDDNLELVAVAAFLGGSLYEVQVDTESPYTVLSLGGFGTDDWGANRFGLNELTLNGNFEDTLDPKNFWVWGGDGDHRAIDDLDLGGEAEVLAGDNSALVGWFDSDPIGAGEDYIYQVVKLPHTPSTLSFWYRVISEDTVDYDYFLAKIIDDADLSSEEVIIRTGSGEVDGWSGDSGWGEITYSLNNWLGQTIRLWFGVTNHDEPGWLLKTYALIDDVRITNSDNFVTTDKEIEIKANDPGSGVDLTYCRINGGSWEECLDLFTPDDLEVGDGESLEIEYYSVDLAGNIEATQSLELVTDDSLSYFGIVINEFMPDPPGDDDALMTGGEWVELFNNSNADIDVDGWKICNGVASDLLCQEIDGSMTEDGLTVVLSESLSRFYANFYLNNTGGDKIKLYNDLGDLIDSFSYPNCQESKSWKRTPDGTGAWADPEPPETQVSVVFLGGGKVKLILNYLPDGLREFNYEAIYTSLGVEKGIYGQAKEVKEGYFEKELFLGTCSANSCLASVLDERKVLVRVEFVVGKKVKLIEKEAVF
ncbi:signal peptidase I [Candidatus Shapirobacteria bacterium]|nr:signal peptidase I [Candidatus Shapirobacteria bacterium]